MLILHFRYGFLSQDDKVFILLHLTADAVDTGDVLIDLSVYESGKEALLDFLDTFHGFIEVVQVDHSNAEGLVVEFLECDV